MSRSLPHVVLSALLALGATGCNTEGDLFFLESEGAVMPVWVRGDVGSGTFLLVLHGGPGGSAFDFTHARSFQDLEAQYAVVYWDQRGSGTSQGHTRPETLTLEQFVADTDAVITLVEDRYDVESLFLLGHSWGGTLAPAYLADPVRHDRVTGLILEDAAYNVVDGLALSRGWLGDYATAQVEAGNEREHWQEALEFLDANPVIELDALSRHATYIREAHGYIHDPEASHGGGGEHIYLYPASAFAEDHNQRYTAGTLDITGLDLTATLPSITLPSLVLWGRHDGILPVAQAQPALDALGASEADKRLVVFEESAHSPHLEEPNLYRDAVSDFVETYR